MFVYIESAPTEHYLIDVSTGYTDYKSTLMGTGPEEHTELRWLR